MPGGTDPGLQILDPLPIDIARPMVLLRLGYRRASQVPEKTSRLIDEVMAEAGRLLRPKAVYREVGIEVEDGATVVTIGGAVRSGSRSLCERLAPCRVAVVFAATIGALLEDWTHSLMSDGRMTRGLLADACGSAAATALGLKLEEVITARFKERGLEATRRYAPGYGDWNLADQTPLFSLLDSGRIGLTLTEDHLMIPAKSISGIIGGK